MSSTTPPAVAPLLIALWHDARGDWDAAHHGGAITSDQVPVAQDIDDESGAWIHAYLHRKEGALGNAAYWYRRAGKPVATDSLDAEWARLAAALLESDAR